MPAVNQGRVSAKTLALGERDDGGILPREEGVDPVIKITHSAAPHSTGKLKYGTCSITVSSAYLGVLGEGRGGVPYLYIHQSDTN